MGESRTQTSEFNYILSTFFTNYTTVLLFTDKQGSAQYAFKSVSGMINEADKVKEIKKLDFEKGKIENFLKDMSYGSYLNNLEIQNNKVIVTYDYYISKLTTSSLALDIFTLIDEVQEIEFKFSFNKYAKSVKNENSTYDILKLDKVEPVIYNRENFKSEELTTISEFKEYINK